MIVSSGDGNVNSVNSAVSALDRLIPRRRSQKIGTFGFSDRLVRAGSFVYAAPVLIAFMIDRIGGTRTIVSHLDAHTVEKVEGLTVESGCGLSGDECQFF